MSQKRQVFRWINGKNPLQYGFDFGLWTRAIVRELIWKKFDVRCKRARNWKNACMISCKRSPTIPNWCVGASSIHL